ncbi:MAG: TetR/AcrR family transcriptional regulator [Actinobacteria bacterium]|nr:TetR/AcrR family transcriptional regulator [Actinomycetota bacterium]
MSAAISPFWAKGFEATTLSDLEEATGVDRSTIYNSFGGKTGLYRSATAAYVDRSHEALFEPLHKGTSGIADIVDFLDRLATMLGSDVNPPGCLIVNDMAADIDHEATNRYLECLQTGFQKALQRSSSLGDSNPHKTGQRSQTLTAAILGVNIVHRNSANASLAQTLIDGLREEVSAWSTEEPVVLPL